ncbi:hypothetical protein [Cyanobium sp. NIES-981]|uniref:hypothetical protein n=1 Tax=Cyanobium sp. NIES-981 TaxID=1851505 RepID=UPI000B35070A|nr:hypothetical protein [Cyanobium sp. NIES-981]
MDGLTPRRLGQLLLLGLTQTILQAGAGTLELCQQWQRSHGLERTALADALGQRNGLTKQRKFATASPGDRRSLYSPADIQRLCRSR